MIEHVQTIIVTILTVGTSAGAWKFYEKRMKTKSDAAKEERMDQKDSEKMYRDDLKERVKKLEAEVVQERKENKELNKQILQLTNDMSKLIERVRHLEENTVRLEKENEELRKRA